jgi:calcineurin-like phosphoesterase family protein
MLTIITKNLFVEPKLISRARAVQIIEKDDPIVTTDWHIMKYINKKQTDTAYQKYKKETSDMIAQLNKAIKPRHPVLMLGDISEKEMNSPDDIKQLYDYIRSIHGSPKILIRGNNDNFDDSFYTKMGFSFVAEKDIVSERMNIIFTHEPISIVEKKLDPKVWLNVHGHIHGSATLWNMQPDDADCHLDVYHGLHDQGIHTLSWYLSMRRSHPDRYHDDVTARYGWT